jgi:uncharacterized protein (TIGR00661 family)
MMNECKTILYCVLNWGIGHATRSIPIIQNLLARNTKIIIASDGIALEYLKNELDSQVQYEILPSYNIQYSEKYLVWNLVIQLPHFLKTYNQENKQIEKLIAQHSITEVISDCRFGCYSSIVPSYFITHQINIKTGNVLLDKIASKINAHLINKYTACWVPDFSHNLIAGELSKKTNLIKNIKYLGLLTRFSNKNIEKSIDVLVLLSGPEPARTVFENLLMNQLDQLKGWNIVIVRGTNRDRKHESGYKVVDMANSHELEILLTKSKLVICRSGYSTIMDLFATNSKALLVPTPGQTEQEYLAKYHVEIGNAWSVKQKDLSLKVDIEKAMNANGFILNVPLEPIEIRLP